LGDTIKRTDIIPQDKLVIILPDGDTATASAVRVYSLSPKLTSPAPIPTP